MSQRPAHSLRETSARATRRRVVLVAVLVVAVAVAVFAGRWTASSAKTTFPDQCSEAADTATRLSTEAVEAASLGKAALTETGSGKPTQTQIDQRAASVRALATHLTALNTQCRSALGKQGS